MLIYMIRLLSRDRTEDAAKSLRSLRKKNVSDEMIREEVSFLGHVQGNEGKGSWKEVFTGTNRVSIFSSMSWILD